MNNRNYVQNVQDSEYMHTAKIKAIQKAILE